MARFRRPVDDFADVIQHSCKEPPIVLTQFVTFLRFFAVRKWCVRFEKVANITSSPLNEMCSEAAAQCFIPLAREIFGKIPEIRIQQPKQRSKTLLVTRVWSSRD